VLGKQDLHWSQEVATLPSKCQLKVLALAILGHPIAVGVSTREIELGRADNSVAAWSEPLMF